MTISSTLKAVKEILGHPVLNTEHYRTNYICHAIAVVTGVDVFPRSKFPEGGEADQAAKFLELNFGVNMADIGSGRQFNYYAPKVEYPKDHGPEQQTARHELLRCAIHLAERLGV